MKRTMAVMIILVAVITTIQPLKIYGFSTKEASRLMMPNTVTQPDMPNEMFRLVPDGISYIHWPFYNPNDQPIVNEVSDWNNWNGWYERNASEHHVHSDLHARDWNWGDRIHTDPDCGLDFYSPISGHVIFAGYGSHAGLHVVVQSDDDPNFAFLVGHLQEDSVVVETGDLVSYGEKLGKIGKTSAPRGCHAHVTLYQYIQTISCSGHSAEDNLRNGGAACWSSTEHAAHFRFNAFPNGYKYIPPQNTPNTPLYPGNDFISLSFTVRNISRYTWHRNAIKLGTEAGDAGSRDHCSAFYKYGKAGWEQRKNCGNRILPVTNTPDTIAPGATVTFEAVLTAPGIPGIYEEHFRVLLEGQEWLSGDDLWFSATVCDEESAFCDVPPPPPGNLPYPKGHPFYNHIECIADHYIAQGYSDLLFHSDYLVTRGMMAVFVARWLGEYDPANNNWENALPDPDNEGRFFDDLQGRNDEVAYAAEWLHDYGNAETGIVNGYIVNVNGQNLRYYGPDNNITRQETLRIIMRAIQAKTGAAVDTTGVQPFTDTSDALTLWAKKIGIASGYSDGSFQPDKSINRGEMAAFLSRALRYVEDGSVSDTCPGLPDDFIHSTSSNAPTNSSIQAVGVNQNRDTLCFPAASTANIPGVAVPPTGTPVCFSFDTSSFSTITDVPLDHTARDSIEALYSANIRGVGCTSSNTEFCPDEEMSRLQIAVFLLQAKHYYETCQSGACEPGISYVPPSPGADIFVDVSSNPNSPYYTPYAAWINELYRQGITTGSPTCRPQGDNRLYYCPDETVSRSQMALFLLRTREGVDYVNSLPDALGIFEDIAIDDNKAPAYEDLYWLGITHGHSGSAECGYGGLRYCPDEQVDRAHAAMFLDRTFINRPTPTERLGDVCFSTAGSYDLPLGSNEYRVQDEDVVCYHKPLNQFKMYFNGSANNMRDDIDALSIIGDGEFLFSMTGSETIPGLGNVKDEDIIRYDHGTYTLVVDGSTYANLGSGVDIDALHYSSSSRFYMSTDHTENVGFNVEDGDVFRFQSSSGSTSPFFDMSDLDLSLGVDGVSIESYDASATNMYLSFDRDFCVPSAGDELCGKAGDIVRFTGASGSSASGTFYSALCFDASSFESLKWEDLNAIHINNELPCLPAEPLPYPPDDTPPPAEYMLHVEPTAIVFPAVLDGEDPPPDILSILNYGSGSDLHWVASEDSEWLTLEQTSGVAPTFVSVFADVSGLSMGVYSETITITSPDAPDTTALVHVEIDVVVPPASVPITLTAESGHTNIQLSWNPTNDSRVAEYHLSRAISGTVDFTQIATIPAGDTTYFDNDPALVPDQIYCYKVDAVRSSGEIARTSENEACAQVHLLELWVQSGTAGHGGTAVVNVGIANAHGLQISNSDIWLEFDSDVLFVTDVTYSALTVGYATDWEVEFQPGGIIRLKVPLISQSPPVLYGDGSLFQIAFSIIGAEGDSTSLDLVEFVEGVGGTIISAPNSQGGSNPVPLLLHDGTFHVASNSAYVLGDLDGNGVVQTRDSYLALDIHNQAILPTNEQSLAADINADGVIDTEDATLIAYYADMGQWPLPTAQPYPIQSPATLITHAVAIEDISGLPGEKVETTIHMSGLADVAGGSITLAYDPRLISEVDDVKLLDIGDWIDLDYVDDKQGLLHVGFFSEQPFSSDGESIVISFILAEGLRGGDSAPLVLSQVRLTDIYGRDFEDSALQQNLVITNAQVSIREEPLLSVNPQSIHLRIAKFGETTLTQYFLIRNQGTGVLNWTANENIDWLVMDVDSGQSASFVAITVDAQMLEKGIYEGAIEVTASNDPSQYEIIYITLEVVDYSTYLPVMMR